MRNKTLVLVDGDNSLFRAFHSFKYMKDDRDQPTSMIYGFPMILQTLINKFKPDEMITAFDMGRHRRRVEILPSYKARNRDPQQRREFNRQRVIVEELMRALGLPYVRKENQEADDIIYALVRKFKHKYKNIIIISNDKDFSQLISKQVKLYSPLKDKMFTVDSADKHGLSPRQSLDYLILDGDASDKIPGVKGVGEKTALAFLQEYGSIKNYLKNPEKFKCITEEKVLEVYKRNKELIGIKTFFRKNLVNENYEIIKEDINLKKLHKIALRYNCKTFNGDNFIHTFNSLANGYPKSDI